MAPGVLANELPQLFVALQLCSGDLLGKNEVDVYAVHPTCDEHGECQTTAARITSGLIGSFLEIVKIDPRRLTRVARLQRDRPTAVVGVRFQHREGEIVTTVADFGRNSRKNIPQKRVSNAITNKSGFAWRGSDRKANATAAPLEIYMPRPASQSR